MRNIIFVVLMLAIFVAAYYAGGGDYSYENKPAEVKTGKPVTWREIAGDWHAEPAIGDFDGDGNQELLAFNRQTGSAVLFDSELNPTPLHVQLGRGESFPHFTWDADGNGSDDLLAPDYPWKLRFTDLGGRTVLDRADLRCACQSSFDFDGDGEFDIAAALIADQAGPDGYSAKTIVVLAPGGKELWRYTSPTFTTWLVTGDFDGDSQSELIFREATNRRVKRGKRRVAEALSGTSSPEDWNTKWRMAGLNEEPRDIDMPSLFSPEPSAAVDLNGDGASELILGAFGAFDIKKGKYSEFPDGSQSFNVLPVDFDGDGQRELCMETYLDGDVMVRDFSGNIQYHEYFGHAMFMGPYVMRTKQRDFIVINKREVSLLIYP